MKVRVTTTVDIDPEAWASEFGVDKADVREDVRVYFNGIVQGTLDNIGLAAQP